MLKKSRIIAALTVCVMMFAVVEPACAWNWCDLNPATWSRKALIGTVIGAGAVIYSLGRGAVEAYAAEEGEGTDAFLDGCKEGAKESWELIKIIW
ncbi:MAG: hypothetical protein IJL18_01105 [Synergistaceae bacterium]|nr:hypothetical protein [Synergistaceae bacterium]